MKNILKENNGGGLQIERYDNNDNIESVVAGLEYGQQGNGLDDLKSYGDDWDWSDVGGTINGYNKDGNLAGDLDDNGEELTANDAIDNHDSTKTVAIWDGEEMTLYIDSMGRAAKRFFGITD